MHCIRNILCGLGAFVATLGSAHATGANDTQVCGDYTNDKGEWAYHECVINTYSNDRLYFAMPDAGATWPIITPVRRFQWDVFGRDDGSVSLPPAAPATPLRVVHINGIATTRPDAEHNLDEVMGRVIETQTAFCTPVKSDLAYNRSRPLLGTPANDLMEVVVQKHRENPNTQFADLVRLVYLGDAGNSWLSNSSLPGVLVHAALLATQGWYQRASSWVDSDLQEIVAVIRPRLTDGERVLLVPHSQGNLFANSVMAQLAGSAPDEFALRQVGIASPAAEVLRGVYRSSINDTVLSDLAQGTVVMPVNLDIPADDLARSLDPRGHNLIDIYLNPSLPGLADIQAVTLKEVKAMVDTSPTRLAQCPHHAVSLAQYFTNAGSGCAPRMNVSPTTPSSGDISHTLAIDSGFGEHLGPIGSQPSPTAALSMLNVGSGAGNGRWRVVGQAQSGHDTTWTQNGSACYHHDDRNQFWAYVFDAS